ncbi:MAG: IS5 family transposase [Caldilineaceae bacterium]|nr:IS5 family transposase [Caldilineaceae bacterium]
MARHTLRNVEFQAMCRHLRRDPRVRVGHPGDLRRFLHGVVYLVRTGIPWRDLPPRFGHWNSVFRRFRRWCRNGVWARLLAAVADARANLRRVHPDSSHVRSHVSAAGVPGGPEKQAQGRSRGGYGTQLHVLVDTAGRLLRVRLTPGQAGDAPQAEPLLAGLRPGYVLADRADDADDLRRFIVAQGAQPVIPGRRNRTVPIDYDRELYRERNIVERSIGWFKQCRRLATRFEKSASSYQGLVMFVAVHHWLQNPFAANVHTPIGLSSAFGCLSGRRPGAQITCACPLPLF